MMQAFPVSSGPMAVPPGLPVTQGKAKPCRSASPTPVPLILCSVDLHRTSRHSTALAQDGGQARQHLCAPLF